MLKSTDAGTGNPVKSGRIENGGMAERFKAAVLKTVDGETHPGVRIPLPPPDILFIFKYLMSIKPSVPSLCPISRGASTKAVESR
jgi:hypothetical protein